MRAKKRSVKGARSIWSMIRRLNSMNRIAAAKQVNDSRVRHFSRATDFSNAFQNVRWVRRRRELCKYSPGGDDIFVPILHCHGPFACCGLRRSNFGQPNSPTPRAVAGSHALPQGMSDKLAYLI